MAAACTGPAATRTAVMVVLVLVSLMWAQAWADSTIQNVSSVDMKVNGKVLKRGALLTIRIAKGHIATISVEFVAKESNLHLKNSRQYFVVDNQFDKVEFANGRISKTLDLVEGTLVANAF